MKPGLRRALWLLMICAWAPFASASAASDGRVVDVRFGVNDSGQTRIVLDLSDELKYRVFVRELSESVQALSIELELASFQINGERRSAGTNKGIGHVGTYAYRTGEDDRARLIFDLADTAIPTSVFLIKPKGDNQFHRLVIDLSSASPEEFRKAIGKSYGPLKSGPASVEETAETTSESAAQAAPEPMPTPDAITRAEQQALADKRQQQLLAAVPRPRVKPGHHRPVIVLDPGHGGKDPGSIGQSGLKEKVVTLAAVKELRDILKGRGYKVILTREGDTYPGLEERLELARTEKADLFLSVHADATTSKNVRGASVYTISDKGTVRLANQVRSQGDFVLYDKDISRHGSDVSEMLLDIAATHSRNSSSVFARILIQNLSSKVRMVNNTHREASYVVLLSPDVPAILLELGFMSNADDEKNLNSKTWRTKTMVAVADSIDAYFGDKKPVKHAMNAVSAGD